MISLVEVKPQLLAVVQRRSTLANLKIVAWLDLIYAAGKFPGQNHNVVVYRHRGDALDVDCGVQVGARFEPRGEIVCVEAPSGPAARLVFVGPYSGLPAAHQRVIAWLEAQGKTPLPVGMEIYGDPGPGAPTTEVIRFFA